METVKLFYEEYGRGKPIIFIHGYPLDHTIWLPLVPSLQKYARLILPDLRGHGKSPAPAGIYSMELLAADILALMDKLGLSSAFIAGHSVGGYIALQFARDFPGRLSGLALIASHCYGDTPEQKLNRLATAEKVERTGKADFIMEPMLTNLTPSPVVQEKIKLIIENAKPKGVAGILRGMAQRRETCDVLSNLDIPVVIIAGDSDNHLPVEIAQKMSDSMKKPWLEIISSAGHMPMLESPKKVIKILRAFICQ
jgi:3-oxoadipate enol-lactonase